MLQPISDPYSPFARADTCKSLQAMTLRRVVLNFGLLVRQLLNERWPAKESRPGEVKNLQ